MKSRKLYYGESGYIIAKYNQVLVGIIFGIITLGILASGEFTVYIFIFAGVAISFLYFGLYGLIKHYNQYIIFEENDILVKKLGEKVHEYKYSDIRKVDKDTFPGMKLRAYIFLIQDTEMMVSENFMIRNYLRDREDFIAEDRM